MKRGTFEKLLNRYLSGRASKKDAELYESIYDSLQQPEKKWEELNLSDKGKVKTELYQNILSQISNPEKSITRRIQPILKIAASILILMSLGLGIHFFMNNKQVETQRVLITEVAKYGEKRTVILEDSTTITLNVGSKLTYYKPFEKDKREISLSGEAFFNVTKDKERPFIVTTKNITTTVLGTSFNIYAYDDEDINVTVSTGKVKVTYFPSDGSIAKSAILLPGEQVAFSMDKNILSKQEVDVKQFIDWKNNVLYFKQECLSEIIRKLERNYNIEIQCDDQYLLEKTITSAYENAGLNEILDDLKFILGFEYKYLSDTEIVIDNI